ncbi:tripartite tricarboxylate transporter TctB family protein [Pseudomonas typographi]|uniref:Tripartite tricarboxylate transporter TctB family protein n=1 Tax=Pseudomonas typographi TaxID=2715964 RepID=A0ABR7Z925_9PSED|nr:tripartite tricarboxylate transporter TctB family protein [Pseudomonas typographi]MBD1552052.1 tripartite tricarboxylate transporter TctB family protein [Pseudomonas typographi]MBD1586616.1 tripartite tricarboxylate transporter TctB family protein [Pseudomonas typographi]MBD1601768.1 tripartite tricarboxylate transporter TctB family protein [Pseudomonas typographi]
MNLASKTNFYAGLLFAGIGLAALVLGRGYAMGTAARMGPGYFPTLLAGLLLVLGLVIGVRAFWQEGPQPRPFKPMPLVVMTVSVVLFALLVDRLGIAVATVILTVGARLAAPQRRWLEVVLLALALSAAAVVIFGYGLGIPFVLWPF